jgi:hypothetical protein
MHNTNSFLGEYTYFTPIQDDCQCIISIQRLHELAAATGDNLTFLHMQHLTANGAVNITFMIRPNDGNETTFQFVFHYFTSLYKKGRSIAPALIQ